MEKCVFKTDKYPNGCKALDARELNCEDCSFYKTKEMLLESRKKAAEKLKNKNMCIKTRSEEAAFRNWTDKEREYLKLNIHRPYEMIARELNRSVQAVKKQEAKLRRAGEL